MKAVIITLLAVVVALCQITQIPPIAGGGGGVGGVTVSTGLSDSADLLRRTTPIIRTITCDGAITAGTIVKWSGTTWTEVTATAATTDPIVGVASTTCADNGTTDVVLMGTTACTTSGAVTAGRIAVAGATANRCADAGTADINAVGITTPVVGRILTSGADGTSQTVFVMGPASYGNLISGAGGFTPTAQAVTAGVTTSITIPYNGTLSSALKAIAVCNVTATGKVWKPGSLDRSSTTQLVAHFYPAASYTGSCTAMLEGSGGGGGGGTGDVSSNTSSSLTGEVVEFTGAGGKTVRRSTLTAALVKIASGIMAAATGADVRGLWSGTPDGTKCLGDDLTLKACSGGGGGGGTTYTFGTGLLNTAGNVTLDPATQYTFQTVSQSLSSFTSIAGNSCQVQTMTATGALQDEIVTPKRPLTLSNSLVLEMTTSSDNVISVKLCNVTTGAITPTSGLTYVGVIWHAI